MAALERGNVSRGTWPALSPQALSERLHAIRGGYLQQNQQAQGTAQARVLRNPEGTPRANVTRIFGKRTSTWGAALLYQSDEGCAPTSARFTNRETSNESDNVAPPQPVILRPSDKDGRRISTSAWITSSRLRTPRNRSTKKRKRPRF